MSDALARRLAGAPRQPAADPVEAWLRTSADRALRQGRTEEGVACLEKLVGLGRAPETRAQAHLDLGTLLRDREEWGRCLVHLRAAAELAPRMAEAHYHLGLAHAALENSRAAAESLRRAADLAPDDVEVLRALGVALAAVGDDGEATRLLALAQERAPEDIGVLESVAMHHLKMGRFRECGEIVTRATAIAPDNRVVKRLAKEASYLVELAGAATNADREAQAGHRGLRVALSGTAARVEHLFLGAMAEAGFDDTQREHARDLWRHYLEARAPRLRRPAEHAAAVEFAIARMDFVDGSGRDQVARRYGVDDAVVAQIYEELVAALDISVFDPRYSTQSHPYEQVATEADRNGLQADEVFQALVEDEYREYQEAHDQGGIDSPRLARDEFEDASVEYGSLLTREMMGLRLSKRERVRKRELERILLVT